MRRFALLVCLAAAPALADVFYPPATSVSVKNYDGGVVASQGPGRDGGSAWDVTGHVTAHQGAGELYGVTLVDGGVTILNASIAVTGTFWQATQPVSGSVSVTAPDAGRIEVNLSANLGATHAEVCCTDADGGTPYSLPAGTRSIHVGNRGPNACSFTIDGQFPVPGSLGLRVGGLTSGCQTCVWDQQAVDVTASAVATAYCRCANAPQTTGACLQFTTVR